MPELKKEILRKKIALTYKDLIKVSARLEEAVAKSPTIFNQDATIQRFEFTFEVAWKLMKAIVNFEGLVGKSPRSSIRLAADVGIISDPTVWFGFLDARNETVHIYKEEMARNAYKKAKEFPPLVKELLEKTKEYTKED